MKYIIIILLFFPLLAIAQKSWWQGFPKKPDNYVTDQQDILSQSEKDKLNSKLRHFEDSTSNQLFIYLAKSLNGKDLEDYSKEIFNTWGIGQKDKNNGILIAIFTEDRVYRIQIGSGLEATLPAELTLQIQNDEMAPHFKKENFYAGIDAGIDQLIYYSKHEYQPPSAFEKMKTTWIIIVLVALTLFIINLVSLKKWNNQPKRKNKYRSLAIVFLSAPVFLIFIIYSLEPADQGIMLIPALGGAFALLLLCVVVNDKDEVKFEHETDDAFERRMYQRASRESSSSNDDSFSGGGGGSSDSGGSSSRW